MDVLPVHDMRSRWAFKPFLDVPARREITRGAITLSGNDYAHVHAWKLRQIWQRVGRYTSGAYVGRYIVALGPGRIAI